MTGSVCESVGGMCVQIFQCMPTDCIWLNHPIKDIITLIPTVPLRGIAYHILHSMDSVLYNEPLQSIASTVIITNALQLTQTDRNHKTSISWNIQARNLKWSVNDNVFVMMAVYPQCVNVNMMVGCEYAYENEGYFLP